MVSGAQSDVKESTCDAPTRGPWGDVIARNPTPDMLYARSDQVSGRNHKSTFCLEKSNGLVAPPFSGVDLVTTNLVDSHG